MATITYKIEFLSDWHCGSGLTAGSDIDALVIKDGNRLPYIPGKTLKGLFREGAETICAFGDESSEFLYKCFGLQSDKESDQSEAGKCFFSNAVLSTALKQALCESAAKRKVLYRKVSSTAIDDNGQAMTYSLRRIEVVVPLPLFGKIRHVPDQYLESMKRSLKWIKKLGLNRNRGLGRCQLSVIKADWED